MIWWEWALIGVGYALGVAIAVGYLSTRFCRECDWDYHSDCGHTPGALLLGLLWPLIPAFAPLYYAAGIGEWMAEAPERKEKKLKAIEAQHKAQEADYKKALKLLEEAGVKTDWTTP